jgi:hypothetical protein
MRILILVLFMLLSLEIGTTSHAQQRDDRIEPTDEVANTSLSPTDMSPEEQERLSQSYSFMQIPTELAPYMGDGSIHFKFRQSALEVLNRTLKGVALPNETLEQTLARVRKLSFQQMGTYERGKVMVGQQVFVRLRWLKTPGYNQDEATRRSQARLIETASQLAAQQNAAARESQTPDNRKSYNIPFSAVTVLMTYFTQPRGATAKLKPNQVLVSTPNAGTSSVYNIEEIIIPGEATAKHYAIGETVMFPILVSDGLSKDPQEAYKDGILVAIDGKTGDFLIQKGLKIYNITAAQVFAIGKKFATTPFSMGTKVTVASEKGDKRFRVFAANPLGELLAQATTNFNGKIVKISPADTRATSNDDGSSIPPNVRIAPLLCQEIFSL